MLDSAWMRECEELEEYVRLTRGGTEEIILLDTWIFHWENLGGNGIRP